MDTITVRRATLRDAEQITAVHCSSVSVWRDPVTRQPTTYNSLDPFGRWYNGGAWMSVETCEVHLRHLLRQGHLPLVAEVKGQLVGEAEYYINHEAPPYGPNLHLSVLYIHTQWQRHGVGHALLEAGTAQARILGIPSITTQPEPESLGFYQLRNFSPWLLEKEMQVDAGEHPPRNLTLLSQNPGVPEDLALRIGRYQCSVLDWDSLWPVLALPGWSDLRRWRWHGMLGKVPVILGLREQLHDANQADGYAWLPPGESLVPAIRALRAFAAENDFKAVDMLLPETALPNLRRTFNLSYQTTVELWKLDIE